MEHPLPADQLDAWCQRWLGAAPVRVLFSAQHLSVVSGLQLADGRRVVVKARPPEARIAACMQVQRHLWASGFPCPELLAGPTPLGVLVATAEAYHPDGTLLLPGPDAPRLYATALATLIGLAPSPATVPPLAPSPAWVAWDHNRPGIWPLTEDTETDLDASPGPAWLDDAAQRARRRLARCDQPGIVGHADWWVENLRWDGDRLLVVHDWDGVACQPEAALAGAAAAIFLMGTTPGRVPTVAETTAFLAAYAEARGRQWTADELEVCWAAGVWTRALDAKNELVTRHNRALADILATEIDMRLRLSGV